MSPARWRACVEHVVRELGVSERKACVVLGQHRSTQRKAPRGSDDEVALTAGVIELAKRYGYRRITALLRDAGWAVNRKRVERMAPRVAGSAAAAAEARKAVAGGRLLRAAVAGARQPPS